MTALPALTLIEIDEEELSRNISNQASQSHRSLLGRNSKISNQASQSHGNLLGRNSKIIHVSKVGSRPHIPSISKASLVTDNGFKKQLSNGDLLKSSSSRSIKPKVSPLRDPGSSSYSSSKFHSRVITKVNQAANQIDRVAAASGNYNFISGAENETIKHPQQKPLDRLKSSRMIPDNLEQRQRQNSLIPPRFDEEALKIYWESKGITSNDIDIAFEMLSQDKKKVAHNDLKNFIANYFENLPDEAITMLNSWKEEVSKEQFKDVLLNKPLTVFPYDSAFKWFQPAFGVLTKSELRRLVKKLSPKKIPIKGAVKSLLTKYDNDRDQGIGLEDFKKISLY